MSDPSPSCFYINGTPVPFTLKKHRVLPDDGFPLYEYIHPGNRVAARCFQLASGTWWISFPCEPKTETTGLTRVASLEEGEMLITSIISRLYAGAGTLSIITA